MFSYSRVCKEKTSFEEIEKMNEDLVLQSFDKLRFADCNKSIYQHLMHFAFKVAKEKCDRWQDYQIEVEPFKKGKPIRYAFHTCPVADFAKENDLLDILPALCNADYVAMEKLHARLVRTTTCGNGTLCDYTIYGDQNPRLAYYPEYRDEQGYRRNKKVNDKQKQIIKLTKQDLFKNAFLGSFITNEKIHDASKQLNLTLPESYVCFLTHYGSGGFFFETLGFNRKHKAEFV